MAFLVDATTEFLNVCQSLSQQKALLNRFISSLKSEFHEFQCFLLYSVSLYTL